MSEETGLDAWFVHEKLVLNLLTSHEVAELSGRIPVAEAPLAQARRVDLFERALATYLTNNEVSSLEVELLQERLKEGQLVWLEQAIAFKGLGEALRKIQRGGDGRASFTATLAGNGEVNVKGTYNAERVTGSTSGEQLSRTKRQFVLGYVQSIAGNEIELRPILIAHRWLRPTPEIQGWIPRDPAHVWPAAIDQFAGVDFGQRVTEADLNILKNFPERNIKAAFAEILGEPEVPNDWGGEQFDLWTSRLSIKGQQVRAAFAFKGPAKFHPMTISDLGKNGDQIDRLAQTAADLIVVQHCHAITAPVVNMLKAYASSPQNPKRYMTIDGYDTVRILRHFGKLA